MVWNYFDVILRLYLSFARVSVWLLAWSPNVQRTWRSWFHIYCITEIYWPVLKHGPRSVTLVQVFDVASSIAKWKYRQRISLLWCQTTFLWRQHRPASSFVRGSRYSTTDTTRKMVSYTCAGWSQGKLWWKLAALLTCKSFDWRGYRGKRPIEPSSSWFPPKFPPG